VTPPRPSAAPFDGRLIVVGGQCRKVGKTALVIDLIRALDDFEWTAVKITPHAESTCPVNGPNCACGPDEHTFAIRQERDLTGNADTSRFLSAGASRAIWLEAKEGRIADGLASLAAALKHARQVIIESNAIVQFWRSDLFLMVVDLREPDIKPSARNAIALVDAFVCRSPCFDAKAEDPSLRAIEKKPKWMQLLGQPIPKGVQILAKQRITRSRHQTSSPGDEDGASLGGGSFSC
jgi:hypothetical protein